MARYNNEMISLISTKFWCHCILQVTGAKHYGLLPEILDFDGIKLPITDARDVYFYRYYDSERVPDQQVRRFCESRYAKVFNTSAAPLRDSFSSGPYNAIKLLKAKSVVEAAQILHGSVSAIVDKYFEYEHVHQRFFNAYNSIPSSFLTGMAAQLYECRHYYRQDKAVYALILSAAITEARLLGDARSLFIVAEMCMEICLIEYGIPISWWPVEIPETLPFIRPEYYGDKSESIRDCMITASIEAEKRGSEFLGSDMGVFYEAYLDSPLNESCFKSIRFKLRMSKEEIEASFSTNAAKPNSVIQDPWFWDYYSAVFKSQRLYLTSDLTGYKPNIMRHPYESLKWSNVFMNRLLEAGVIGEPEDYIRKVPEQNVD